jgi:hypothetical protein
VIAAHIEVMAAGSCAPGCCPGLRLLPGVAWMRHGGVSLMAVRLQAAAEQGESHADEGGVGDCGRHGPRHLAMPATASSLMPSTDRQIRRQGAARET